MEKKAAYKDAGPPAVWGERARRACSLRLDDDPCNEHPGEHEIRSNAGYHLCGGREDGKAGEISILRL